MIRIDHTHGDREAIATLTGVPCEPAHAPLKHLQENPLGLIRQLEHRVQDLDALRARTIAKAREAAQEAARAREAIGRPFKHAADLQRARDELQQITEQMKNASIQATEGNDTPPAPTATTDDNTSNPQDDQPVPRRISGAPTDRRHPLTRPLPPAISPQLSQPESARPWDHRLAGQKPERGLQR